MVAFLIGSKSGAAEDLDETIEYASSFDGLVEIKRNRYYPGIALLCFRDKESAQTAQWMLEMAGSEKMEGGEENDAAGAEEPDG